METKILVIGYYGAKNIGDELLLKATSHILKENIENANISAITYDKSYTEKNSSINGISRNRFTNILREINDNSVIIVGGGSLLQNKTSNRSLIYYLTLLWYSIKRGKKVYLLGNGIGPISEGVFKNITLNILGKIDRITVRDIDSYKYLKIHGIKNVFLSSDLVYNIEHIFNKEKVNTKGKIGINLRNWENIGEIKDQIVQLVKVFSSRGIEIKLISFQKNNDNLILKELIDLMNENFEVIEIESQEDIEYAYKDLDMMIGMRLHSLILSTIFEIPFIGIVYDPKVKSFCISNEQEYIEYFEEESILKKKAEKVYLNREIFIDRIKINNEISKKNSIENIKLIKRIKGEIDEKN